MEAIKENNLELWQTRATMWELLALSFRYPDALLAEVLATGEWAEAASELAQALDLDLPPNSFDELATDDTETLLHALRAEATRLFVGAPDPVCSPYEGVWRAVDDGVQPLLFVNPHSMDVERFMKACGLGRPEGTNEPLDHVATECELLQHLASLVAGIVELPESAPALGDFPGGSPEAAYEQFICERTSIWIPRFAQAVKTQTREPFYQSASELLGAVVAA